MTALEILKSGIKNRKLVIEGIKNNIFKQEHIEQIFQERKAICHSCTFHSLKVRKEKELVIPYNHCTLCGCKDEIKLRSLGSRCTDEENPKWLEVVDIETAEKIKEQIDESKNINQ